VQKAAKDYVLPVLSQEEHAEIVNKSGHEKGIVETRIRRSMYMHLIGDRAPSRRPAGTAGTSPVYDLLFRLMVHPRGVDIVDAYACSPARGWAAASAEITDSLAAIAKVSGDLVRNQIMIWRFPTAVAAGVASLGFAAGPGLTKIALAWGETQKTWLESAIESAMNALFVLDLLGGPIGAAISEVSNIILAAVGAAVSLLSDVEQDQAASATSFGEKSERLSTGGRGLATILEGVVSIAAAAAPTVLSVAVRRARAGKKLADAVGNIARQEASAGRAAGELAGSSERTAASAADHRLTRRPETGAIEAKAARSFPASQPSVDPPGRVITNPSKQNLAGLRVRLKTSSRIAELSQHEAD
jgi:hypothetical protein